MQNYDVEVSSDAGFVTIVFSATVVPSTATVSPALAAGTYFWHVRARDNAGNLSAFSGAMSFTVDITGPGAVTLLAPANGSTTGDNTPTFDWTDASDPCGISQYEIEIDGSPTLTGVSTFTPVAPLADGLHSWRVRAQDGAGNWGSFTGFFTVTINTVPPNPPAGLTQHDDSAGPSQPVGFTDNDTTMVFKGTISDPAAENVQLQVEAQPVGTLFTNSPSASSAFLASDSLAEVTISGLLNGTSYHWQARTVDVLGNASGWVSFGANPETSADFTISVNTPPADPSGLGQFKSDTVTVIAIGAATDETTVVFKGTVSDPDGNACQLQVEVKAIGVTFDGTTGLTTGSLVPSGSVASATVTGLAQTTYHWRARAIDSNGAFSGWVSFGGNPESSTDFQVDTADPPNAPTGLAQFMLDGTTSIAIGGQTVETGVVLKGNVSDPDAGNTVKLQVEVKLLSQTFDGTISGESGFVASGAQASVTVSGLTLGTYHWRARAVDNTGLIGAWLSFGGNPETSTDFEVISANNNPTVPTGLGQFKADTVTAIGVGATTNESTVVFKGTVSDSDSGQTVKLQVEVKPVGTAFTNTFTVESAFVAIGSVATATATGLTQVGHHWQARTVDSVGGASAWVSFPQPTPNAESANDFVVDINDPPATPVVGPSATQGQFTTTDVTIPVGGSTSETTVRFKGTLGDPDAAQTLQLQVEIQPLGTAFTGTPTGTSASVANGALATLDLTGIVAGSYHWQARAIDSLGLAGPWVSFGGNPETSADFTVAANSTPAVPAGLSQHDDAAGPAQAVGFTDDDTTMVFKGTVSDPDAGQLVQLEVEVKAVGVAFDGTGTLLSPLLASGSLATVTFTGLIPGTSYHWRARTLDNNIPTAGISAWVSFGGNLDPGDMDFKINQPPSSPAGLGQFKTDGTTVIAVGGTTNELSVICKGTVSDLDAGQTVKLQVQLVLAVTPFDLTTVTAESALVASGTLVSVTVPGLTNGSSYHWQARTVDSIGGASAWIPFDAAATHFTVSTAGTTAPSITAGPTQHDEVSTPAVGVGFIDQDTQMVFKATLSDADGQTIQLEIEIKTVGTPFANAATHTSASVTSLTEAVITASGLAFGSYKWQFRAVDSGGNATAWTTFNATEPHFIINGQPSVPTGLGQFKSDGATAIAVGGTTDESQVISKATVTDSDANTCQLEVEMKPVGTAFDGTGTVLGTLVPSGSIASTTVTGLANGNYHWRCRTVDSQGGISGWVSFGGNTENPPTNPAATDVTVAVNTPPSAPTALGQFKSNGTTSIPTGGTTDETSIVAKGTVSDVDAGQTIRIQIEIRPVGTAFTNMTGPGETIDNITFFEGAPVASGSVASVTVTGLTNGVGYHWQIRAVDSLGGLSGWVAYGGNPETSPDVTISLPAANNPPAVPTGLEQNKADGISPIGVGATTNENIVIFNGGVSDPDGNNVKLQIEIQPVGTAFTGTPTNESPLVSSGSDASVTVSSIPDGPYHWQARAMDSNGAAGGWVSFGGNPETSADFVVDTSTNTTPAVPSGLGQFMLDGTTSIGVGATTNENGVVFKGIVSDSDAGQSVKLQVEVQPIGTGFSGIPSSESGFVGPGSLASATVSGLAAGSFHWQARTLDSAGASSAWVSFGGNPETSADFVVSLAGNTPPSSPSGLGQFKSDGVTVIGLGATTNENVVVLQGTVSDPDGGTVKLQIEVQPAGTAFTGTPSSESAFVSSGSTASVTVSGFGNGSYHWQARAVDPNGATSSWVEFNVAATHFVVDTGTNSPPSSPTGLGQTRTSGVAIGVGGSTNESTILFTGVVSDPNAGGVLRLQVEIRPIGTAFTGAPTGTSAPFANGATATLTHGGMTDGVSYHWQARTIDANNATSGWVSFGGNTENPPTNPAATDFTKVPNNAPAMPAGLDQLFTFGPSIPIGTETSETTVVFSGTLTDADGDVVRIQVEVRPVGFAFTNGVMATSAGVGSGSTASISFGGLLNGTSYHWQARTIDSSGATSAWVSFGGNAETSPDFIVNINAVLNFPGSSNRGSGGGCGGFPGSRSEFGWLWAILTVAVLFVLRRRA